MKINAKLHKLKAVVIGLCFVTESSFSHNEQTSISSIAAWRISSK